MFRGQVTDSQSLPGFAYHTVSVLDFFFFGSYTY